MGNGLPTREMLCEENSAEGELLYRIAGGDCSTAGLLKISPSNYLSATSPPTITLHGKQDSLVPYSLSVDLHEKVNEFGVLNLLLGFKLADHVMDFGYNGLPQQVLRFSLERLACGGKGGVGEGIGRSGLAQVFVVLILGGVWLVTGVTYAQVTGKEEEKDGDEGWGRNGRG